MMEGGQATAGPPAARAARHSRNSRNAYMLRSTLRWSKMNAAMAGESCRQMIAMSTCTPPCSCAHPVLTQQPAATAAAVATSNKQVV